MKLVQLIKEIGEANPKMAYSYDPPETYHKKNAASYKYAFETEETEDSLPTRYAVWIEKEIETDNGRELLDYEVSFAVRSGPKTSFDIETNKGELYRVMATIVKMLKERIEEDKKDGQIPKIIRFYPSKTKGEGDERRTKLYAAYAKTQLPNSEIRPTSGGRGVEIVLNNQQ